jgi:hypothetical protein
MQELTRPVRHEGLAHERAYGKIAIEPFAPGFARPPAIRGRPACALPDLQALGMRAIVQYGVQRAV